jgi:hypothetical protein
VKIPDALDTVVCAPDDGWKYHWIHVEQFPDINKLCNVASCWIYIGILLGVHPILHISRIKVNSSDTAIWISETSAKWCPFNLISTWGTENSLAEIHLGSTGVINICNIFWGQ